MQQVQLRQCRPSLSKSSNGLNVGNRVTWSLLCRLAVLLWIAHFVKREFETVWVHRFSRPTMPMINLLKNSWYYWMFACLVAYVLCHPDYTPPSSECVVIGAVVMLVSEVTNLAVHVQLRNLRPAVREHLYVAETCINAAVQLPHYRCLCLCVRRRAPPSGQFRREVCSHWYHALTTQQVSYEFTFSIACCAWIMYT